MVNRFDTEVFVIGGGPAGLATALAARGKGMSVTVADGMKPPIDKACGEGLMPDALSAAHSLGILIPPTQGAYFRGIRFVGNGVSAAADFPAGAGWGMRRTALHQLMVEQAEQSGIRMLWDTPVMGVEGHQVFVRNQEFQARWIVGADGSQSRVRNWVGLDRAQRDGSRFGFRRHYRVTRWTDYVEIYWGAASQIYITPVAQDEICVALISRDPHLRLDQALPYFNELSDRLAAACIISEERGAVSATRKLRSVQRGCVALLGDASGSVDAITGEGICLSFLQARAWADAIERENLVEYEAAHKKLFQRPRLMSQLLLSLDRWPALRRRVLNAFAARPELFARVLAGHVGANRLADIAAATLALGIELI